MPKTAPKKTAPMSDAAVQKSTGKTWAEWFEILDKAGAKKMNHTQIAAHLRDDLGCSAWWSQMVAVGYERDRGLREKHQKPDGYHISASKTIAAPVSAAYKAWQDAKSRTRWLAKAAFTVRTAIPNRSLRITWVDGKTSVEVTFLAKGASKSQVVVDHRKLADAKAAARMKQHWGAALDRLKCVLET